MDPHFIEDSQCQGRGRIRSVHKSKYCTNMIDAATNFKPLLGLFLLGGSFLHLQGDFDTGIDSSE